MYSAAAGLFPGRRLKILHSSRAPTKPTSLSKVTFVFLSYAFCIFENIQSSVSVLVLSMFDFTETRDRYGPRTLSFASLDPSVWHSDAASNKFSHSCWMSPSFKCFLTEMIAITPSGGTITLLPKRWNTGYTPESKTTMSNCVECWSRSAFR